MSAVSKSMVPRKISAGKISISSSFKTQKHLLRYQRGHTIGERKRRALSFHVADVREGPVMSSRIIPSGREMKFQSREEKWVVSQREAKSLGENASATHSFAALS